MKEVHILNTNSLKITWYQYKLKDSISFICWKKKDKSSDPPKARKETNYYSFPSLFILQIEWEGFTTAKVRKQSKCPPMHEWIKNMCYVNVCVCVCVCILIYRYLCVYTHTVEYCSALTKRRKSCHFWQHGWTWRTQC